MQGKIAFLVELPLLHWKILQTRHHVKEHCKWNFNCSLHRLIFLVEKLDEGHFMNKKSTLFTAKSWKGAGSQVPPVPTSRVVE